MLYEEPKNETTVFIYDEQGNLGYVKTLGSISYRFIRNYGDETEVTYVGDQVTLFLLEKVSEKKNVKKNINCNFFLRH